MAASSYFLRFEKGYRFEVDLWHRDRDWVRREGWTIWLEDAKGRRIDPITMPPVEDATDEPARAGAVLRWEGSFAQHPTYVPAPGTDNAMDVRLGSTRGSGPTMIHTHRLGDGRPRRSTHFVVDFYAPDLAASPPGRLTLVMRRGDDVLRFTWHVE